MSDQASPTETAALTAAIASGDPEAFARFYDAWFDKALVEARRSTGRDDEFCLDVVQDAMMRVIRSIRPLESEAALHRWMRVVVRSCACDRLRSDIRLHEQLEQLDDRDVHLLVMRHRFGWTLHRIGRALGVSHGAVDRRLRRLVSRLRKSAKEDFHGLSTW